MSNVIVPANQAKTILIVDDNQDFREMLAYLLDSNGYRVLTASDGITAVNAARNDKPDLILMDIKMPGHTGAETAAYLKSIRKFTDIPLIFLTSIVLEDQPEGKGTINIDGRSYPVVLKSTDTGILLRTINHYILHKGRPPLSVLIIEDSPSDAHLIRRSLEKSVRRDFKVHHVESIQQADHYLYEHPIDVIILDLTLADSKKFDTLAWMVKQSQPVVVTTASEDESTISEAFRNGAQDYLIKGDFSERELSHCVAYAVERAATAREIYFLKRNVDRIVQDRVREALSAMAKKDTPQ
jgi:CheY-like chemotaxis protein